MKRHICERFKNNPASRPHALAANLNADAAEKERHRLDRPGCARGNTGNCKTPKILRFPLCTLQRTASDECLAAAAESGSPRSRKRRGAASFCADTRKGCGKQQPGHIWGVLQPDVLLPALTEIGCDYAAVGQVWARPDVEGAQTLWSSAHRSDQFRVLPRVASSWMSSTQNRCACRTPCHTAAVMWSLIAFYLAKGADC